jgi:hypothetical protein
VNNVIKTQWLAIVTALLGISGWAGVYVDRANRQDAIGQSAKAELNTRIDDRVDKKLARFVDREELSKQIEGVRTEQKGTLQGIRSGIEKNNTLIIQTREDQARSATKVDDLEKDVHLLLEHQLRAAADLPSSALASQLPNVEFLYGMAARWGIPVPVGISNSIRQKLVFIRPSGPAYWSLAGTTISQESAALVGDNLNVQGTIGDTTIIRNEFRRRRVMLDGAYFAGNIFIECVIEYHGGATSLEGNIFQDCLFVVSLSGAPPPAGQKIIQTLLASDLRSVKSS